MPHIKQSITVTKRTKRNKKKKTPKIKVGKPIEAKEVHKC